MAARSCVQCGKPLPPPKGSGRPRTKCADCSPTRLRDVKRRAPHKLAPVVVQEAKAAPPSVYAATLAKLTAAALVEDPAGVAALVLAAQIDQRSDSGASLAAMAKQHAASMADAMSRAAVAADPLDELARRRDVKRGSA